MRITPRSHNSRTSCSLELRRVVLRYSRIILNSLASQSKNNGWETLSDKDKAPFFKVADKANAENSIILEEYLKTGSRTRNMCDGVKQAECVADSTIEEKRGEVIGGERLGHRDAFDIQHGTVPEKTLEKK